jgi:hypothetical protein
MGAGNGLIADARDALVEPGTRRLVDRSNDGDFHRKAVWEEVGGLSNTLGIVVEQPHGFHAKRIFLTAIPSVSRAMPHSDCCKHYRGCGGAFPWQLAASAFPGARICRIILILQLTRRIGVDNFV